MVAIASPVSVTALTVKVRFVAVIVMMVANRGTDHLIANKKCDGFPEVPEPTLCRLTILNSPSQTAKHQEDNDGSHNLQHHEFRDLQPEDPRKMHIQQTMPTGVGETARQVKARGVSNVMEMIFCRTGTHSS